MIDDIDDLDNDINAQQAVKPKESGISHKLDDLPNGMEDCYWCGRARMREVMQQSRIHNSIVYICRDCQ